MAFVVRIHRPRGLGPWSGHETRGTRFRRLDEAQVTLEAEVNISAHASTIGRLRRLILKLRARNAQPGERIEAGDYDHWIEEDE